MSQGLHRRAGEVFAQARGLRGPERVAYLDAACDERPGLREAVERLLAHDSDSIGLLGEAELASGHARLEALLDIDSDLSIVGGTEDAQLIGPYRVLRRIGQGGMGVVYEAEQSSPRRRVALKVLQPQFATPTRMQRFRREAELLGRLRHAGIAQIYEAGTFDLGRGEQPFFAMELVEGADLRAHCVEGKLPARAVLALLGEICDAVQHAHDNGIVHRDLKPDNVLVTPEGHPKVLDFGVARASEGSTVLSTLVTEEGDLLGTIAFMAPEQIEGPPDEITPRADVYALGAIAFELLAGRLPHDVVGLPLAASMRIVLDEEPPRLGKLRPELAGDVETIVGKALEKEPGRRYADAAALGRDLRAFLEHRTIAARPPRRLDRAAKFARRNKALVGGVAATGLAVLVGLVVALVLLARESELRAQSDENAARARAGERRAMGFVLQTTQDQLEAGELARAVESFAAVDPDDHSWAVELLRRALPTVLPSELDSLQARWLDDRHLVAPARAGGGALVFEAHSGKLVRRLAPEFTLSRGFLSAGGVGGFVHALSRSPSEELVIIEGSNGRVAHRMSTTEGPLDSICMSVAVDRDGRLLSCWRERDAGVYTFWVDGEQVAVVSMSDPGYALHSPDGRRVALHSHAGRLSVRDARTGAALGELDGLQAGAGTRHVWAHDGSAYLAWDAAGCLVAIDPERVEVVRRYESIRGGDYQWIDVSRDGARLVTPRGVDVQVWDLESERLELSHATELGVSGDNRARFSPDGERVLVGAHDVSGVLLELKRLPVAPESLAGDGDPRVTTYRGHSQYVYHCAVSPDGRLVASRSLVDTHLRVWDAATGETLATLGQGWAQAWEYNRGHLMCFSPDGRRLLATLASPESAQVELLSWDLLTGEAVWEAPPPGLSGLSKLSLLDAFLERLGPAPAMRLSRKAWLAEDGSALAVQQVGGQQVPEGRRWRALRDRNEEEGLSLAPDGRRAAIACVRSILVVDRASLDELARFSGQAYAVAWSPDGRTLAAGGTDGRIRLFDGELSSELLSFRAHDDYVFSLAWTPDSSRLVSCSGDATVRVWDARPYAEREADEAGYRALLEGVRELDEDELVARFEDASSVEERGALVRVALERRAGEDG